MNTLLLNNVTTIDLAYVDSSGKLKGHSVTPGFLVSGGLNGEEQVVMDFGTCKRRIKERIDHKQYGWDHKLLWSPDVPVFTDVHRGVRTIETQCFTLRMPEDASQRLVYQKNIDSALCSRISHTLSEELGLEVAAYARQGDSTFVEALKESTERNLISLPFSYTHGLAYSTSWGCQNIAHGHKSFLVVEDTGGTSESSNLVEDLTAFLDNTYIVNSAHVTKSGSLASQHPQHDTHISYMTPRGHFSLMLNAGEHSLWEIPVEPTIENIIVCLARAFKERLLDNKVSLLGVSEGLWKGAVLNRSQLEQV